MPRIRFLLDENVSSNVIDVLEARGHEVTRVVDIAAAGTPDAMLALFISHESMVIITHDRHFRSITKMLPEKNRNQYAKGAGRLQLEVPESDAREYLEAHLPFVEFSYAECQREGEPFQAIIQKSGFKLQRRLKSS